MYIKVSGFYSYLMCFSIGIPKTMNFSFVPNGELMVIRSLND